jgi:hypothetical protein
MELQLGRRRQHPVTEQSKGAEPKCDSPHCFRAREREQAPEFRARMPPYRHTGRGAPQPRSFEKSFYNRSERSQRRVISRVKEIGQPGGIVSIDDQVTARPEDACDLIQRRLR